MAVTFNIQFRISVATKVIRLTDTSTGFTYGKGCFKVEFPNGVVRNLPDFSAPDISTAGNYIDIPCEVDASGNVITGSYIISYAVINNLSAGQTPLVRPFDFNWVEPTNGITNFSDVITPEVVFKDLTSYSPIGSFTGALTRTISSSFPSTSEVSGSSPVTSTSTNTVTVVSGANYYEGVYTPTSNVSVAYTHSSNAWLTILYTRTFSKTFAIKKCPNQLELVQKINAYRVIIDAYKETNDTQFNLLSEQYDLVIALYSHLIAMHQTTTQDGSEPILRELLSILEPYTGTYTYQSTKMLTFSLAVSGANSFSISDGTNTDSIPLGTTVTFASGNAALVPIVTNNNVTYSPTFGTLINTFAQGNDSRFHNPVTIGTANGLSISTQALSLAAATTGSAGAMSASDKTKLDGIAAGATANVGTVTSVALTVPAAFSVTGSPITTSGTLAITAGGTSAEYITGAGALVTLNTANVPENTNLYFTTSRARTSISLTTTGTTGAATYDNTTGVLNIPSYIGGVTSFNTRTGAIVLSSADVTTALTYTPVPNNRNLTINGVSFDLSADRSWTIASGVTSFNTRTGAITPTAGDYTTALVTEVTNLYYTDARARAAISLTTTGTSGSATYDNATGVLNIPAYQGGVTSFNTRTGAITLTSSDVTTALTYTPYNATNPSAYIALTSLSFAAGNAGYNNTTGVITIPTNNTQLTNGSAYITLASLSFVAGSGAYNNTTGVITIPTSNSHLTNGAGYITGITSGNVTTALGFTPENAANKGIANGYASLDGGGLVPSTQLPSYVDDVLEFANLAALPATGETGKIYVALDTNKIYRWSGATYIEVSPTVGTIWGGITGTLSNQTDLQSALNAKQASLSGTGFVKSTSGTISYDTATYYPNPTGTTSQYVAGDGSLITFPVAGQSGSLVRLVRNQTGATLTKGTVVYISGATGNNPVVAKALATGDATSAQTFGLLQANIANNAEGYVVISGDLTGLDTSAFTEGQQLYLSAATAGTYTATKQYAPNHLVYIGIVTRAHPTLGQIEVNIQNGYEMDELHNVSAQSPSNNDGLFYNTTTSLWEKKSIATALGFTPYNATNPNNYIALTALSFVAGSGAYNSTTGVITIPTNNTQLTNGSNYITLTSLSGSTGISYNSTTGAISSTITQYTDALARASISFAAGSGAYNSTTGVITIPTNTTHLTNGANFIALTALSSSATGLTYTNTTGVFSLTAGYEIPTTASIATWDTAYTNRITTLTTTGSSGSATLSSNTLNIPTYTLSGLGGQPLSTNLTSLSGLTYASTSFVKMTASGTFALDTNTYYLASNPSSYIALTGLSSSATGLTYTNTTGVFSLTAGYAIPTTASATNWDTAYTNRITSLTTTGSSGASTLVSNVLNIPTYTLTGLGGVPTTRSLTINGTAYDLSADRTWTISTNPSARAEENFVATAAQTTFTITGGYVVGLVDVYVNGVRYLPSDYTATNGTTVVLGIGLLAGDAVTILNYTSSIAALPTSRNVQDYTATAAQTTFTVTNGYIVGLIDVFVNGSKLTASEFTATNGTTFVLTVASTVNDQVQSINYTASVNGISGAGTANYVPKFTASGTIGNSALFQSGNNLGLGTTSPVGDGTVLNLYGSTASTLKLQTAASGTTITDGGEIVMYDSDLIIKNREAGIIQFATTGTERMRITAAGSVGIGTTSPTRLLDVSAAGAAYIRASDTTNSVNVDMLAASSGGWIGTQSNHSFQLQTNNTERMRIASGGNVGIGTSSPSAQLQVSTTSTSQPAAYIEQNSAFNGLAVTSSGNAGTYYIANFRSTGVDRMRILDNGSVLIGTTTDAGLVTGNVTNVGAIIEGQNGTIALQRNNAANIYLSKASGFTEGILINFFAIGTSRGNISTNGVNTSYNTSSDYRLKEDLKEYNGLNIISKLKTYDFKWKDTNIRDYGVMAHELQEVLPNYVNGDKDAVNNDGTIKTQAVDYSKLVPVLVKAIQEQQVQIEELKTLLKA
jgi:hypothetical protein